MLSFYLEQPDFCPQCTRLQYLIDVLFLKGSLNRPYPPPAGPPPSLINYDAPTHWTPLISYLYKFGLLVSGELVEYVGQVGGRLRHLLPAHVEGEVRQPP